MQKIKKKGYISNKKDYSVLVKYSDKSHKKNLVKFIPKSKQPFEISVGELIELVAKYVNMDVLAPMLMESRKIDMVKMQRQMRVRFDRDFKAGEEVVIPFEHMHPIEFAIAEEAVGVAGISDKVKTINKKEFEAAKERVNDKIMEFTRTVHAHLLKQQEAQSESDISNKIEELVNEDQESS